MEAAGVEPASARPRLELQGPFSETSQPSKIALNRVFRMHLTIDLPADISEALKELWSGLSRHALETLAVDAYRTGVLSESQGKRLLGFENRFQLHALLKQFHVPLRYTGLDPQNDLAAHRELGISNSW